MKIFRLCLLICAFFPLLSQAAPFTISEEQINDYLATKLHEKVPLQNRVGIPALFQLDYKLHNLATKIGQTDEKRVEITGIVEGILQAKEKSYNAEIQLTMDTIPYYDAEKGALFLKEVRLIRWQARPEKYQKELQLFLPLLSDGVSGLLNQHPVYVLDETKTTEAMVKRFGKAIVVKKGQLRLETAIF
ncbi:DUF1439 domain-containing protein [Muribacter muris]|uniref:DUF1439 domain-containing protein n=1 Tax=Muribacter muris TaxID=67855 RepID=A0A4Y9K2A4_9PAST|nr:DUF1439 domain-containing protein [Muribacter muris]MBF0827984.1 DUF1439 domain-containing protein [Muribacter muris]TFV12211.1 DUF1439 domain-containing protein [Muribacter muris]